MGQAAEKPKVQFIGVAIDALAETIAQPGLKLVAFNAKWCAPCFTMSGTLKSAVEYFKEDDIKLYEVNTETSQPVPEKYGVKVVLTLLIVKDGTILKTIPGVIQLEELINTLIQLEFVPGHKKE